MSDLGGNLVKIKDLAARWGKTTRQTRRIVKNHLSVLDPVKIGRTWLIKPENIIKFEREMRLNNVSSK